MNSPSTINHSPEKKTPNNDEYLLSLVNENKHLWVTKIIDAFWPRIYAKCLRTLKNKGDAEDQTQEIFIKIFNKIDTFKSNSTLLTWIYTITRNQCTDYIRKESNSKQIPIVELLPEDGYESTLAYDSCREIATARLYAALGTLRADYKDVLVRRIKKKKLFEIAEALSITVPAVKMRILRAKRALCTALEWR